MMLLTRVAEIVDLVKVVFVSGEGDDSRLWSWICPGHQQEDSGRCGYRQNRY